MTTSTFSRKTIAIALAAGVTLGGVTVATPVAGAVAGVEGASTILTQPKRTDQGIVVRDDRGLRVPDMNYKGDGADAPGIHDRGELLLVAVGSPAATWGGYNGGIYDHVNVTGGNKVSGFGFGTGGEHAPSAAIGNKNYFGDLKDLSTLTVRDYVNHDEVEDSEVPSSIKKVLAVTFAIANDINNKGRVSPEVEAKFAEFGYTGDFGREQLKQSLKKAEDIAIADKFHDGLDSETNVYAGETAISREEMAKLSVNGMYARTPADLTLTSLGALSYRLLEIAAAGNANLDFDALYKVDSGDYDSPEEHVYADKDIQHAVIRMAAALPDDAVNVSGRYMIRGVKGADFTAKKNDAWDTMVYPLFDLDNSNIPKIEDLHKPTSSEDIYVSDVKKDKDGNYVVTRNDDKTWTINLKDIRDKIAELEKKKTVTPDQLDAVKKELAEVKNGLKGLDGKDAEAKKALGELREDLGKIDTRVTDLEKRVDALEKATIKEVKDNGDGTYTLIREDGSKVKGNIDTSGSVTNIKSDGKGNLIITIDGKDQTVPLAQTTVTETNKGKPNHTITITTPDGNKVTFNAFDVYVTDVKKNAKGDYDIYRSDVNDGKTVWKTIVLSDIRGKITKLEGDLTKLTEKQAADVKDIKNQIAVLEKEIKSLQGGSGDLDKRVSTLETKVTALTLRVTNLEKRVKGLEETDAAWAKCYAGIGATGVPMLMALPLALMSDLNIPGLSELNTQIQRTIGIYNPEAAKWMAENRGLFSAATGVLTAAGVLGMLIHTAKECQPYNKTPGVQDNMNPIIEGSSKIADQIESGSSKAEGNDKGSSVDAGSSTAEGSAMTE